MSAAPKAFTRDMRAPHATFDPHGAREATRELEWRGNNPRFVGPVADPAWLWLLAGCPVPCASAKRAITLALARRGDGF